MRVDTCVQILWAYNIISWMPALLFESQARGSVICITIVISLIYDLIVKFIGCTIDRVAFLKLRRDAITKSVEQFLTSL